jgi:hypothetical protein
MKRLSISVLVLNCVLALALTGCGGGSDNTVIQPTVDYQPTAEEQKMQADMEAARGSEG